MENLLIQQICLSPPLTKGDLRGILLTDYLIKSKLKNKKVCPYMPNFYGAPEISIQEVDRKLRTGEKFILLDVREKFELDKAKIDHPNLLVTPLSRLTKEKLEALPENALQKDGEIVVICHHGIRSALVTAWLRQLGWNRVFSMDGGLAAYAREIDPAIGSY